MKPKTWKQRDPLYRGDERSGVALPKPAARTAIVAHILYLGGAGRETQYTSVTERQETAQRFAGTAGRVWTTGARAAVDEGAKHLSQRQLINDLVGYGKGSAAWSDPWEVSHARAYVEQWSEHLLDWSGVAEDELPARVGRAFR